MHRGHAIYIHKIWLKYVLQLSPFAPVLPSAHGCQLNPLERVHSARTPGRSAQPRCPPVGVYCETYSAIETTTQFSPETFRSSIHHRQNRPIRGMPGMFSGGGFSFSWISLDMWCAPIRFFVVAFERGFRLQATHLSNCEHFTM